MPVSPFDLAANVTGYTCSNASPWLSHWLWNLSTSVNPFYWLRIIVHHMFGDEPPEYLIDFLPIGVFYGDEGPFLMTSVMAVVLSLAVVLANENRFREVDHGGGSGGANESHGLGHFQAVSFCRITADDVVQDVIQEKIEDAFSPKQLAAACFTFDIVHELCPSEAVSFLSQVRQRASAKGVPTFSFIENHGLSAGYLLSLSGSQIFANELSLVGKLRFCEPSRSMSMLSRGANYFDDIPLNPERMQRRADDIFMEKVRAARGQNTGVGHQDEVKIGHEAVDAGLVDGIKDFFKFREEQFPSCIVYEAKGTRQHQPT